MKKRITAVLLCVALLLTLSVNVSAETAEQPQSTIDTQITPVADEITVTVGEDGLETIENEISDDDAVVMPLAQTSGIISGAIYRIKNVASGKYMNVDYGIDANGTNIYQWTGDGSTEQKFKVVYSSTTDSYMLYAMCSSNGTNRVADVYDSGGVLVNGANIKLHDPIEPPTQQLQIISIDSNKYRIAMKQDNNFVFTAYGTSNGSAGGTSSTSAGNIFISTYTGSTSQQWQFELLENPNASPAPIGYLDTVSSTLIGGWAYQSDIPDTALTVHIYIINNSTGEQKIIGVTAGGYRADLKAAGYGNGYHAFHYAINWKTYKPGTYTVRAFAIGVNSSNPQLTNSPKTFTVRNPTGNVDALNSNGVSGWVWKPDAPNEAIEAHLYVRKTNGETVWGKAIVANAYRSDLYTAGYGNGYHGFSIPIDWSTLPEEKLQVTVYAVDGSGYNPSFYDGYYYNGVEEPTVSYVWPTVSKRITQNFKSGTHYGIDIGAVTAGVAGDPIYCFADGYVIRSEWSSSYGYVVYINHTNPRSSISTYIQTKYAHMSSNLLVSANTNITKGTQVGYMNTTGQSNGVHLHFETVKVNSMTTLEMWANGVIDKSKCIDPLNYFDSSGNVLTYNINSNNNPWGLTFDINEVEIDVYDRVNQIIIEEPTEP